jgi:hypothetical protein
MQKCRVAQCNRRHNLLFDPYIEQSFVKREIRINRLETAGQNAAYMKALDLNDFLVHILIPVCFWKTKWYLLESW